MKPSVDPEIFYTTVESVHTRDLFEFAGMECVMPVIEHRTTTPLRDDGSCHLSFHSLS